jgi:stage V sporulation protein AD
MGKRLGKQSILFDSPLSIASTASVVGPKEGEGPLSEYFDLILPDTLNGAKSWEQAEAEMVRKALDLAIKKAGLTFADIDFIISGDLLDQNIGTTFGIKDFARPLFGIFSACSTIGEAMILGSVILDAGCAQNVLIGASSHFSAAEKQFRNPLNLGGQRPPTSTWTVTGDGAAVLSKTGKGPYVMRATVGKIIDMGITDANNMGAAMAPAAVDSLVTHFRDFNLTPDYYDLIITGDLGYIGKEIVLRMVKEDGYDLTANYTDCGIKIFDRYTQDTHSGGSGCACSAVTFAGYLYKKLKNNELKKLLFVPTGALLSPTSSQQKLPIPGIAHAIGIEM